MFAKRMESIPFSSIRSIVEKSAKLDNANKDVVHLEIGRPDFDTPEPIKHAGRRAIDNGYVHYTSNYGITALRKSLSDKIATENGVKYSDENEIIVTAGATEAIFISILAHVNSGDEVLIPNPAWTYSAPINVAGGTVTQYELDPDNGFLPSIESIRNSITEDTSLLIINSPHNPTGSVIDTKTINNIRDIAVEHDLLVLSDEIYEKLLYDDVVHTSIASIQDMYERTITVNGFSKAYSMTGWRLGYLAAPKELIDPIIRLRQYTSTCAPSISQHAGIEALSEPYYEPMVKEFSTRRELVVDRVSQIEGMTLPVPRGAFYAFPTIPEVAESDEQFVTDLLDEEYVALVHGSSFGSVGKGRVRIAYSNSYERINEAFDRIEQWVDKQS